jgi:hypothetical protein
MFYERFQRAEISVLFKLSALNVIVIPIGLIMMMAGRMALYFETATLVVYSIILSQIKQPIAKYLSLSLFVFFTIYTFYNFFQSKIWRIYFVHYQTIFSSPIIY